MTEAESPMPAPLLPPTPPMAAIDVALVAGNSASALRSTHEEVPNP
ncbi:MAG: hypothetical protein QM765_24325 [Myxococcales bacterium]